MSDPAVPSPRPNAAAPEPDWTDQVTDLVVDVVDRIHDSTTGPLIHLAKGLVIGLVAGIVGVVALLLTTILVVRALDLAPGDIWIPYLVVGVLSTVTGLVLWSKRSHPSEA
jgi:hypothetical protein